MKSKKLVSLNNNDSTALESYNGFDYKYWAQLHANGEFESRIMISKYFENRKETLEKMFILNTTYIDPSAARIHASHAAIEIIDGLHPYLTVKDIDTP